MSRWTQVEMPRTQLRGLNNFYCVYVQTFTLGPNIVLNTQNEPSHEIMVLFVLRKLIFQTRMRSHPVGLDV